MKDKEISKEKLQELLKSMSCVDIAKQQNVARSTIYNWIKKYNIKRD
jgi:transposase